MAVEPGSDASTVPKHIHEFRDPIHTFIHVSSEERDIIDSRPVQRLRHIHQLALTFMVYPGATHRRFEHSLGVMELASRIFDTVTDREHLHSDAVKGLAELTDTAKLPYWRAVVRLAALCHDIGHLPFSHAAEDRLPKGWNHERLSRELLRSEELSGLLGSITPPVRVEDVVKLAVGAKGYGEPLSMWEAILAEIITGDALGSDRIDYLLRDAHHTGVAYGRFDHYRLIECMRILPKPGTDLAEFTLGIEVGGLQSAESLLLARYLMYSQVYFHAVRRAYDCHLNDFLERWLPDGRFSTDLERHLSVTDDEILSAIAECARNDSHAAHVHAARIFSRKHFKLLRDVGSAGKDFLDAGENVYAAVCERYGADAVRRDRYFQRESVVDFPVLDRDGSTVSSLQLSSLLTRLPTVKFDYVFIDPEHLDDARIWLKAHEASIMGQSVENS